MELLVFKFLLECKDLLAQLAYKANVDQKGHYGTQGLVGEEGDRGEPR